MDICASKTGCCQPRGKNDESVPNSRRSGPSDSSVYRNTSARVSPGRYRGHPFELDVSRWMFGQMSAAISASLRNPAPKCGITTGATGYLDALGTIGQWVAEPDVNVGRKPVVSQIEMRFL